MLIIVLLISELHMKIAFNICILGLLLAGCAITRGHTFLGNMSQQEISAKLVAHKTTKEDVRSNFGDPEEVNFQESGKEGWLYSYKRSAAKGVNYIPLANSFYNGTDDTTKNLRILFDLQGYVEKYSFSSSKGETQWGMFQ
jgi:hypothetical protein